MTGPAAFLSYARFDDRHHDGLISDLRARLSAEVRVQTGRDFPIFQDREDIAWGQNWQSRIDETLDAVTLLLPVVTPGFFHSRPCRGEVERFLARERMLGRRDLILPIYLISAPEFDDESRREADDLARELWTRQFADWRELRFEPLTSPVARRAVARLAAQIRSDRSSEATSTALVTSSPAVTPTRFPAAVGPIRRPAPEPPTLVVDAYGRGDFITISAALAAARAGDRILVKPALYQEQLVIDKPVELLGDGPREDIEVHARSGDVVLFRATMGRVARLTLRQVGSKENYYAVDITTGRLDLEDCDISSSSLACVGVHDGAAPRIRRNHIHDGWSAGILVYDNGLGLIEDNDVIANASSGVSIKSGANPTLRGNRIRNNICGINAHDNGLGLIEDNDITTNASSGVQINSGANPTVRRNRICDCRHDGILVVGNGLGVIEDNDITANALHGVEIRDRARPTLRRNRIHRNAQRGVWVHSGGGGTVEDNDLSENVKGALLIEPASAALVTSARNTT